MRRFVILAIVLVLVGYALVVAVVAAQQDRLVFAGAGRGDRPIEAPGVAVFELPLPTGGHVRAVLAPNAAARGVLVWCVGNGEDLRSAAFQAVQLAAYGLEVVIAEYPGYGASPGRPDVAGVLAAGAAAAAHAERLAAARGLPLLAGGSSLGTFAAIHIAGRFPVQRLLLRAPPTTLAAAAKSRFPWLPVDLLLRHRFDNLAAATAVRCPVLVVHGDADAVVPLALGRELVAALGPRATLHVVPGAGHNDLSLQVDGPLGATVRAFLEGP